MNGFTWRCEACGAKGSVREGRGFQLTEPVSELMEEIRAGKYGTKWQRLVEEEPEAEEKKAAKKEKKAGKG